MQIPSIASTFMAMTRMSPSESAAYLQDIRSQTSELVKEGIESRQLNPFEFQAALSKTIGNNAHGVVTPYGKIDYEKLDLLMGGSAQVQRQSHISSMPYDNQASNGVDLFESLFSKKSKLFSLTA